MSGDEDLDFEDVEYEYEDNDEEMEEEETENVENVVFSSKPNSAKIVKHVPNIQTSLPSVSNDFNFNIIDFKSVTDILKSFVKDVSTLLELDRNVTQFILQLNSWNKEKVIETFCCDPEMVLKTAGLTLFDKENVNRFFYHVKNSSNKVARTSQQSVNAPSFTCKICYDDFTDVEKDGFSLGCGHLFCKDCFGSYLKGQVEGGPQCVSAHCPEHKCTQAVTQDVYDSFLVGDKVALEKFDRYLCTHFVNCNKTMRFCPAANCEKVATGGDIHSQNAVRCPCSCVFCFDCGEESHAPSGCAQLSKWIEKCMSDGESAKWIFANTKKCPKCNTRIEKNQGCNHMTCRQCKHEFCWICMGNWAKHQQCNRYASEASQSEQTAQEIIRAELDRYLHYYNRYQAHDNSLKFAAKQRIAALQKMREMQERQSDAWIDVQYVRDAVEEVIECRRVLKYTYVVGFYMEEWCPERELFASHQQMLEEHTEKLHECTEGKNVFKADRTQVVNWTRVTQNFRNAILDNFVDGEMMAGEAGATRGDLNNKQVWSSSRKKPADSNGNDDRSATHIMNASLLRTSLSRAGGRTGGGRGGGRGDEGEWEDARGFGLGDDDEEDGLDEDLMRAIEASLADSR